MRRWLILLVATGLCTAGAAALPSPSWPPGRNGILPQAEYVLQGNTRLSYNSLTFADGTIITTSGYDFDLEIKNSLSIEGTLLVRAYPPDRMPPQPAAVGMGAKGNPHFVYRGPDAYSDAAVRRDGLAGGAGERGPYGITGTNGRDAGAITLRFEPAATAKGKLVIHNVGGTGGAGGPGGKGGPGGDGQQGGRCDRLVFESGNEPGRGGVGGQGGPGGFGGRGGDGGRGGLTVIKLGSNDIEKWLRSVESSVAGGEPGKAGPGGPGGDPGQPGFGGRGNAGCNAAIDKMGSFGTSGPDETKGMEGANKGPDGIVKLL